MTTLLAFDNDGVLRDESVSCERCIVETVDYFDLGNPATGEELDWSRQKSNNDWDRTYDILVARGVFTEGQREKVFESS